MVANGLMQPWVRMAQGQSVVGGASLQAPQGAHLLLGSHHDKLTFKRLLLLVKLSNGLLQGCHLLLC